MDTKLRSARRVPRPRTLIALAGGLAGLGLFCVAAGHEMAHANPSAAGGGGASAALQLGQLPMTQSHPVYSLVDNRLLAHGLRQGGLAIPMGTPAFAKY